MHGELRLSLPALYGFLIVLARVSGVIAFVPIPGLRDTPAASRALFALALTFVLLPVWPAPAVEQSSQLLLWGVGELAIGLLIGLTVSMLLEGLELASQMVGLQAGFSYASTIDPSTQADSSVLQILIQLFAGMLFFALGFDRQVIQILCRSFERLPPGGLRFGPEIAEATIHAGSGIFVTGLRLAMPVLALMLLLDLAIAVLGRIQAQLQLIPLSFSLKMLAGLGMLASALTFFPSVLQSAGARAFTALANFLNP